MGRVVPRLPPNPEQKVERLTKREQLAAMAMQGLIAGLTDVNEIGVIRNRPQDVAELAALYADTLLAELEKK